MDEDRGSGDDGGSDALSGREKDVQSRGVPQPEQLPATVRLRKVTLASTERAQSRNRRV